MSLNAFGCIYLLYLINIGALKYLVSEASSNKALRAMLIRDWLLNGDISNRIIGSIDDTTMESAQRYISDLSPIGSSQIDVDVSSAVKDLKELNLIDNFQAKEEEEAQDTLKQLWNEAYK